MLKRLIKYDMKAISKVAVPLFIASGIISLLCCAVLYYTFGFAEEINSIFNAIMMTGGLYFIGIITIVAMVVTVWFTVLSRYYKSIFTDEGYLNMVIPVTKRCYLNSKIISGAIWYALSGIVAWACVFISVILPTLLYDTTLISLAFNTVKDVVGVTNVPLMITALALDLFISVVSLAKDVVLIMAAITIACVFIKRFKVLACVVFYFIIGSLEELFKDAVLKLGSYITSNNEWVALAVNAIFEIVIIFVTAAVMYFISLYVLEKKLNLE